MNLYRLLQQRAPRDRLVRIGPIGAGKFGSIFLDQVPTMLGLDEASVIADLDTVRAHGTKCGKTDEQILLEPARPA